ncbi:unnamed protein product [Brassica rapa]|uniref:Uncharacterized protein n=1 Tax=Brassica campestris TaxID=3711 RepID=A0A8D9M9U6_BRACM|nr:unnamed protein product [Brassica rapa]
MTNGDETQIRVSQFAPQVAELVDYRRRLFLLLPKVCDMLTVDRLFLFPSLTNHPSGLIVLVRSCELPPTGSPLLLA